jgi:hypothetical protein
VEVSGQYFEEIWGNIEDACEDFSERIEESTSDAYEWAEQKVDGFCEFAEDIYEDFANFDSDNSDVSKVYESNYFSSYNGALVVRHSSDFLTSWAIGNTIFLNHSEDSGTPTQRGNTLNHEYGHVLQCQDLGFIGFMGKAAIPSLVYNVLSRDSDVLLNNYYNMPWEYDADRRGGVNRGYAHWAASATDNYFGYFDFLEDNLRRHRVWLPL